MQSLGLFAFSLIIAGMLFTSNAQAHSRSDLERPSQITVLSAAERTHDRHRSRRRVTATSARPRQTAIRAAAGYSRGQRTSIEVVTLDDGHPVEIRTARAYRRMAAAARGSGVTLHIVSGFRTMAHQRQLYAAYRAGRGNLAARPGFSNHQSGLALDLNTQAPRVYRWLLQNANGFGFCRTVPSERWHWEWRPAEASFASRPFCR